MIKKIKYYGFVGLILIAMWPFILLSIMAYIMDKLVYYIEILDDHVTERLTDPENPIMIIKTKLWEDMNNND